MSMRTTGTAALLAATGLVGGLLIGVPPAAAAGSPGTITTVAGGLGRGLPTKVFQTPDALTTGPDGALYVGGETLVREFSNAEYSENVIAGTGGSGEGPFGPAFSGDGKSALHAQFSDVSGLAVDGSGNVLVADIFNNLIRVVARSTGTFYGLAMKAGNIYAVAGDGTEGGFSGDGGPATSAALETPAAVAVDAAGNLPIADSGNARIRVVAHSTGTFYGVAMTAGDIYTVAGDGARGDTGDGGPATAAEIEAHSVTADAAGNIVINGVGVIRVVAAQTGTFYGVAMTAGDIYTVAGTGTQGYSGDGGPATAAELDGPSDVAVDPAGNLAIADAFNARVRVVAAQSGTFYGVAMTAGDIYTVAGDGAGGPARSGGLATSTSLSKPNAVTFDAAGNLVIGDPGYDRVFVIAATTGRFYQRAMTTGHIYIVAGANTLGFSGSGGKATNAEITSCCRGASSVAVDGGNYLVTGINQLWFIANTAGTYFGRVMAAGDTYVLAGNGFSGYSGDGGLASSARLQPAGVVVDSAGNLVIGDAGNKRVRVVAATTGTFYGQAMTADHIYTVAGDGTSGYSGDGGPATVAQMKSPAGVAVDGAGNLVIADPVGQRIRVVAAKSGTFYGKVMTAGDIYTVAGTGTSGFSGNGGRATKARLAFPQDVAVDGDGNLVIADALNHQIRLVAGATGTFYGQAMTAGDIYTVAGTGTPGGTGLGGPATAAELTSPLGVAVDGAGNLVITDVVNNDVTVVAANGGTFYGVAMTAGDIYLVAGDGRVGFSGDGGPATAADLNEPVGVAVDGAGNLVIDDSGNFRIRVITG